MRFVTGLFLIAVPASVVAQDLPHWSDAPLRCIQFADEREGWAAGDDGAVWHTIDGGKKWERQPTGTRASLRAIHFLTPYSGWAVGRTELSGGGSVGTVLATSDGGLKWTQLNTGSVPGLNVVKFFGERVGVAAGDGSDSFPSGLFGTMDGGRTWKPIPGTRTPSWLAGDFSDAETGVVGGTWSRVAPIREGMIGVAQVNSLAGRSVNAHEAQWRSRRRRRPGRTDHGQPRYRRRSLGLSRTEDSQDTAHVDRFPCRGCTRRARLGGGPARLGCISFG